MLLASDRKSSACLPASVPAPAIMPALAPLAPPPSSNPSAMAASVAAPPAPPVLGASGVDLSAFLPPSPSKSKAMSKAHNRGVSAGGSSEEEQEGAAVAAPVPRDVQMSDAAGPAAAQDVEMMAGAVRVELAGGGGGGALLVEDVD